MERGDDATGTALPEVGDWSEDKYDLVKRYADMFTTSMKPPKWQALVYLDLFAGAGRARIKGTSQVVDAIPLRVLSLPYPFDVYVFCDTDEELLGSLENLCHTKFPHLATRFVYGDSNKRVDEILGHVPKARKDFKVLTLCVADPFDLKSLKFSTIRSISRIFVDFIVLIATDMDAHRNTETYFDARSRTVEEFLGDPDWRTKWRQEPPKAHFGNFIADRFFDQMTKLGYKQQSMPDTLHVRSTKNRLPLYRLALFSRNDLGAEFWQKALKSSSKQSSFGW